jgi:hypothetical protein
MIVDTSRRRSVGHVRRLCERGQDAGLRKEKPGGIIMFFAIAVKPLGIEDGGGEDKTLLYQVVGIVGMISASGFLSTISM